MQLVIIVGGGLSGLAAARSLFQRGIPFLLLEQSDRLGGRLKSDIVDGFTLDHGFQVLFDAYPHVRSLVDVNLLEPRPFPAGAQIWDGKCFQLIDQHKLLHMALTRFLPLKDKINTLRLQYSVAHSKSREEVSAETYLRKFGFSELFLDRFARPFFGGVFLDRSLSVSADQFKFVFQMLGIGKACLLSQGIGALPNALIKGIPEYSFRLNTTVSKILTEENRLNGVQLTTGEEISGHSVILAVEPPVLAQFGITPSPQGSLSSICLYFETPTAITQDSYLMLNMKNDGVVSHVAPLSNVAPSYAPLGRHLVSVTILGDRKASDGELISAVRKELTPWFPDKKVATWRFIRSYRIHYAQMPQLPGFKSLRPHTELENLFIAGEAMTNSSIDGALQSGLEAASLAYAALETR